MKKLIVIFLIAVGSSVSAFASNSVSCNGGIFTVTPGSPLFLGGGSYIPVIINIANYQNGAGVLQYFAKNGFVFPTTSNPPPGLRAMVAANQPSFESYKYQYRDSAGDVWFFERRGGGMLVIAETGDASRSVNWYFEQCNFQ